VGQMLKSQGFVGVLFRKEAGNWEMINATAVGARLLFWLGFEHWYAVYPCVQMRAS